MNLKRHSLAGLALAAGLLATFMLVRLTAATPGDVQDTPFVGMTVAGTVATPDGGPLPPFTFVWMAQPDPDHDLDLDLEARGRSNVISTTGAFSFANVAPGRYILRAVPRDIPPFAYAPSRPVVVDVFTGTTVPLTLTFASVTGTVYAPLPPAYTDLTPTVAIVHVYTQTVAGKIEVERRWVWPENNGVFVVGGLPTGTFEFRAEPFANDWYWWSDKKALSFGPDSRKTITLTLNPPQVAGWVVMSQGVKTVPVSEALVRATASDGSRNADVTGLLGRFAIGGMPVGVVTFTVNPPPEFNWLQPPLDPLTASIQPGQVAIVPITMTMPDKTLFGWVRTNQVVSRAVQSALVQAHRVGAVGYNETETDAAGFYTLTLAPGMWAVRVSPITTTAPANWVYPFEERLVGFENNRATERKMMNFRVLVADATVYGAVRLPGGIIPSAANPPVTVTAHLHNDEGIGLEQVLGASGAYSFAVPHGPYKLDLAVESPLFAAPMPQDIYARATVTPTLVHTITLLARNAIITGMVTDGVNPAPGVPIIAWNPDTHATFGARTSDNGVYALAVYSDTWLVRPAPLPKQPYVYVGDARSVVAHAGQIAEADFTLTLAGATIHGVLEDDRGNPVGDVTGWAFARSDAGVRTGAPVRDGMFDILVPAGTYTVGLRIPSGQTFLAQDKAQTVTLTGGDTETVTFELDKKTALLWGDVHNVRTNKTVARDVDGQVWAWDDGMWTGTDIRLGNLYTLPVPAGDWRVNFRITQDQDDPSGRGFIKVSGPRTLAVPSHTVQYVPLPVAYRDGTLIGTVVLTDGVTPAVGAVVVAEALSPDLQNLTLRTPMDVNGQFTLTLPSGLYNVRSVLSPSGGDRRLINPRLTAVIIPPFGSRSIKLQYRQANALITGTLTLANAPTRTGLVYVYGWTADDGFNWTLAPVNGVYTLPVLSGETWKLVGISETPNWYWITRTLVTVPGTVGAIVHQNLTLDGPKLKPAPVTVMFDAAQDQYVELSDGTRILIPGGAMPATGNVILHITPIANAIRHRNGDVLGLSYVFEAFTEDGRPITDQFNQDVVVVFRYDPDDVRAMGIEVNRLRPAYFSTTTNSWTLPDSFVVDETRHEITMQINHFTRFALDAVDQSGLTAFLPVVMR